MFVAGFILLIAKLYIMRENLFSKNSHRLWVFNSIFLVFFLKYTLRNWSLQYMPVKTCVYVELYTICCSNFFLCMV